MIRRLLLAALALSLISAPALATNVQIDPAANTVKIDGTTNTVKTTVADGANVTIGAQADSACSTDTGTCTHMGLLKRLIQRLTTLITTQAPVTAATATATTSQLAGCRYVSTPDTFTTGQQGALTCGTRGALHVELWNTDANSPFTNNTGGADAQSAVQALAVGNYNYAYNGASFDRLRTIQGAVAQSTGKGVAAVEEAGRPFSNIATNTTTTVKSGAGFLHAICVNTKGASANVATIYDNTAGSGTKIGTLDTTTAVACLVYDVAFATGLTIVTATGTAADLTVSYR